MPPPIPPTPPAPQPPPWHFGSQEEIEGYLFEYLSRKYSSYEAFAPGRKQQKGHPWLLDEPGAWVTGAGKIRNVTAKTFAQAIKTPS
jgi:hypothetical protein